MRIEVDISKKLVIAVIAVLALTGTIYGVVASHNSEDVNPGHDVDQITGIEECQQGEVLSHTGAGIECVSVAGSLEQTVQCETMGSGGSVTCPSGWTRSGCSGGKAGGNSNGLAFPQGTNACRYQGESSGEICVHCIRIA